MLAPCPPNARLAPAAVEIAATTKAKVLVVPTVTRAVTVQPARQTTLRQTTNASPNHQTAAFAPRPLNARQAAALAAIAATAMAKVLVAPTATQAVTATRALQATTKNSLANALNNQLVGGVRKLAVTRRLQNERVLAAQKTRINHPPLTDLNPAVSIHRAPKASFIFLQK